MLAHLSNNKIAIIKFRHDPVLLTCSVTGKNKFYSWVPLADLTSAPILFLKKDNLTFPESDDFGTIYSIKTTAQVKILDNPRVIPNGKIYAVSERSAICATQDFKHYSKSKGNKIALEKCLASINNLSKEDRTAIWKAVLGK